MLSFPFVAYGMKQHQQLLGTLPQSHTCANTLELPNYTESLLATNPHLAQEWNAAAGVGSGASISDARRMDGCKCLFEQCCHVMEDRLLVRHTVNLPCYWSAFEFTTEFSLTS